MNWPTPVPRGRRCTSCPTDAVQSDGTLHMVTGCAAIPDIRDDEDSTTLVKVLSFRIRSAFVY